MGEFDWNVFIDNLWERENAQGKRGKEGKGGYRNGKYYPYYATNGYDVGPGFDMRFQSDEFKKKANTIGFTKEVVHTGSVPVCIQPHCCDWECFYISIRHEKGY